MVNQMAGGTIKKIKRNAAMSHADKRTVNSFESRYRVSNLRSSEIPTGIVPVIPDVYSASRFKLASRPISRGIVPPMNVSPTSKISSLDSCLGLNRLLGRVPSIKSAVKIDI